MLKVGIIGCGFMGHMHNNCYALIPEAKVVAAADVRPEMLKEITDPTGAVGYANGNALIDEADVDLIDIALPTFLHAEHAIRALEAGKDVLCEKPMAMNPEECQRMIDAAKASSRKLMIAHCIRFWPEYVVLKDYVDNGQFGKLLNFTAVRTGSETKSSWDNWLLDEVRSGSQSLDRHIHDTDYILHLLGRPKAVESWGSRTDSGLSHIYTRYEYDGPVVFCEGSNDGPDGYPFTMAFQATFEKGSLVYSIHNDPKLMAYQDGKEPWAPELPTQPAEKIEAGGNISDLGGYFNEIRYYVDCILNNQTPTRCLPEDSKQSVEVDLAEIKSATIGKRIEL